MDSPETRPMMRSLDGFVFVDSREMRGGPILVQRVTGRPGNWIRLVGGDKSAISRLTGKPTMLFDDKWKVLRAHQRGHVLNEGVRCVLRGRSSRRRRERHQESDSAIATAAFTGGCANFASSCVSFASSCRGFIGGCSSLSNSCSFFAELLIRWRRRLR